MMPLKGKYLGYALRHTIGPYGRSAISTSPRIIRRRSVTRGGEFKSCKDPCQFVFLLQSFTSPTNWERISGRGILKANNPRRTKFIARELEELIESLS